MLNLNGAWANKYVLQRKPLQQKTKCHPPYVHIQPAPQKNPSKLLRSRTRFVASPGSSIASSLDPLLTFKCIDQRLFTRKINTESVPAICSSAGQGLCTPLSLDSNASGNRLAIQAPSQNSNSEPPGRFYCGILEPLFSVSPHRERTLTAGLVLRKQGKHLQGAGSLTSGLGRS